MCASACMCIVSLRLYVVTLQAQTPEEAVAAARAMSPEARGVVLPCRCDMMCAYRVLCLLDSAVSFLFDNESCPCCTVLAACAYPVYRYLRILHVLMFLSSTCGLPQLKLLAFTIGLHIRVVCGS